MASYDFFNKMHINQSSFKIVLLVLPLYMLVGLPSPDNFITKLILNEVTTNNWNKKKTW